MRLETEIERILAISPEVHPPRGEDSNGRLMIEYLRRADHFLTVGQFSAAPPLFCAVCKLGYDDDLLAKPRIDEVLSIHFESTLQREIMRQHLLLQAVADQGNSLAASNADLYDPLIRVIEGGAPISLHHGELIVDGMAVRMKGWRERFAKAE